MSLLMDALKQAENAKRDRQSEPTTPPATPAAQSSADEAPGALSLALVDAAPAADRKEPGTRPPEPVPSTPATPAESVPCAPEKPAARSDQGSAQAATRILAASESRLAAQRRRNLLGLGGLGLVLTLAIGAYYHYASLALTSSNAGLPQAPVLPEALTAHSGDQAQAAPGDADVTQLTAEDLEGPGAPAPERTVGASAAVPAITPWREGEPPAEPTPGADPRGVQNEDPAEDSATDAPQAAVDASAAIRITRGQRPDRVASALLAAYADYRAGRWQAAESGYRAVLAREPGNRDAQLGLAALAVQAGEADSARQRYRALLRRDPKDPLALAALASLGQSGDIDSETELKLHLVEQPQSAALHFALANLYAGQRRWPLAQQAYFEAQRLAPEQPDYAFNLAVSLEQIDRPQLALDYYRRALRLAATRRAQFDAAIARQRVAVLSPSTAR